MGKFEQSAMNAGGTQHWLLLNGSA
uniref:Uncharacterized protein n=1 Tax=Arundo donax TaxID=35708 RepID=A0A0A9A6K5_ARUDO